MGHQCCRHRLIFGAFAATGGGDNRVPCVRQKVEENVAGNAFNQRVHESGEYRRNTAA